MHMTLRITLSASSSSSSFSSDTFDKNPYRNSNFCYYFSYLDSDYNQNFYKLNSQSVFDKLLARKYTCIIMITVLREFKLKLAYRGELTF